MSTTKLAGDLDYLGKWAARAVLLDPVSSAPSGLGSGDAGRVWFNTTDSKWYYWDGSVAVDPRSRARHTGTQTASTISDFDTAVRLSRVDQMAAATSPITVPDGTLATHAATKGQLDSALASLTGGQTPKGAVRVAATANINLASPGASIDGVSLTAGDVVLLTAQTTGSQNGPYVWTASGSALTRATNWDTSPEAVLGSYWVVLAGTKGDMFALLTNDTAITLGTDTPAFQFISGGVSISGTPPIAVSGGVVSLNIGAGLTTSGGNLIPDLAVLTKKLTGVIPTTTTGIVTVSGSTVTFNHGLNNWGAEMVLTAYTSPAAGYSQGDRILNGGGAYPSDANNLVLGLPANPASNNWHYAIYG